MNRVLCSALVLITVAAPFSSVRGDYEARDAIDEAVNKAVEAVESNYATFVEANAAPLDAARTFLNGQIGKLNADKKFAEATKVQAALADLEKMVMQKAVPFTLASPAPKPKAAPQATDDHVPFAPRSLTQFRQDIGKKLVFRVVGDTTGYIWGGSGNVYTDDSALAKAAVHAGLLAPGQTGIITLEILPGQKTYQASARNGITSGAYGPFAGSYRLVSGRPTQPGPPFRPLLERLQGEWSNPARPERRAFGKDGRFSQIAVTGGENAGPFPVGVANNTKASWVYPNGGSAEAWLINDDVIAFVFYDPQKRVVNDGEVWFRRKQGE
jgi:hypothetical protein